MRSAGQSRVHAAAVDSAPCAVGGVDDASTALERLRPSTVAEAYRLSPTVMRTAVVGGLIRATCVPLLAHLLLAAMGRARGSHPAGRRRDRPRRHHDRRNSGRVQRRRGAGRKGRSSSGRRRPRSGGGGGGMPAVVPPRIRRSLGAVHRRGAGSYVFVGKRGRLLRRSNSQTIRRHAPAAVGMRLHNLRHTGNALSAQPGATPPGLKAQRRHANFRAALTCLHTNSTRDRAVADVHDGW